ncbi:uncharacterized protein LOC141622872 [Silene latifolia]|uniref:uncharacterized protein LOC141622872 n=1 Tax=Silene latifolia TaxID=37657 RepID=UPI003D77D920
MQTMNRNKQSSGFHTNNYETAMMMNKASERVYEDFEPVSDLMSAEGYETVILCLPGFKKDQLKVQLTTSRILRVSGERPIGDNKWKRFSKEFRVPPNVDTKEITAKFEGGILHIKQPKLITSAPEAKEQEKPKQDTQIPNPQTQKDAPSVVPNYHESEAKTEKKEDMKEEEIKSKREYGTRMLKELRKPGKPKKVVVSVLIILFLMLLGFYTVNLYRSVYENEQGSVLVYEHQGFLRPT